MNSRFSFSLIGLFVLILTGIFVGVVLWLSAGPTQKSYETYVAYMRDSVSGLGPNAPVKYLGVEVGKVRDIALDPDNPERVRLLLQIEPSVPIKEDTVALLSTQGLTGITHVELTGSTRASAPLRARPGRRYPEIETRPSVFTRLETAVPELISQLQAVAVNSSEVAKRLGELLDASNIQATSRTLRNMEQLTASLAAQVSDLSAILGNVSRVSGDAARVTQEIPTLIERVNRALGAVEQAASSIDRVAGEVKELTAESQRELRVVAREALPRFNATMEEMQQLADTLRRFAQDLKQSPEMLLYGRPQRSPGPGE